MSKVRSAESADVTTGLVANATAGSWDLAIDETIDGPERWFAQIEGPSLYLYFEIANPRIIQDAIHFIEARRGALGNRADGSTGELAIGRLAQSPVSLLWDEEYQDRLFFVVGDSGNACMRCSVSGGELKSLVDALRQLAESLSREHPASQIR